MIPGIFKATCLSTMLFLWPALAAAEDWPLSGSESANGAEDAVVEEQSADGTDKEAERTDDVPGVSGGAKSDQIRLRWGPCIGCDASRSTQRLMDGGAGRMIDDEVEQKELELDFDARSLERSWRFRIVLPRFSGLFGLETVALGTEQGFQIEIDRHHLISLLGEFGFGNGFVAGGGIGYAYQFEFVEHVLFLELGGTLGFHWEDGRDDLFSVVMFTPMLHVGYKYVFFSLGPRFGFGYGVLGGVDVGFMVRI